MKKVWIVLVPMLALGSALQGENGDPGGANPIPLIEVSNDITTGQNQNVNVSSAGGVSDSASSSNANVNIDSTSISDFENRTPPLTSLPPYLPYWTHGGWGTVKAYFPNGPSINDQIYETTFDPENPEDIRELRSVLKDLPHAGLGEALGGVLNSVAVVLFGSPNKYHHGRGLEIVNSVTRDRRPEGKPLLVFIDSNVDMGLLREEGYAYMGKVNIEGDVDRNWDQAYKAAVTEALLWDVDILLVSGGMKGVTVGSNTTFPAAAAGYSQANYSLSLMGSKATGITEGKGKAVLSADAYRFYPGMVERRRIPESLYERIRFRGYPVMMDPAGAQLPSEPAQTLVPEESLEVEALRPVASEESEPDLQAVAPACETEETLAQAAPPACATPATAVQTASPACQTRETAVKPAPPAREYRRPVARRPSPRYENRGPGINVSRQLYEMAGFTRDQQVGSVNIR